MKSKLLSTILFTLLLSSLLLSQRSVQNTIRKYKNDEGVVSLNYKGEINELFKNKDKNYKTSIDAVDIIAFNNGDDLNAEDAVGIKASLEKEKYDLLINAKQKDGKLELYTMGPDEEVSKIFAHVKKDQYNVYFIMSGKIVLSELPELGLDFKGSDIFEMIPKDLGSK